MHLTAGSRKSQLALWQTNHVLALLKKALPRLVCELEPFDTRGDLTLDQPLPEIGGKGLFTSELEAALLREEIDIAVHSLKDLPTENTDQLTIGAIVGRADVRDVIVSRGHVTLKGLKPGAVVGTSSPRRTAQALGIRNDLNIKSIRGNVPTRVAKVERGEYDAAIMAAAGLVRLGMAGRISEYLGTDQFLPAPGQGALAVQCRTNDKATFGILQEINNQEVSAAVLAERTFLKALQGGCSTPVGALASVDESGNLQMQVMVSSIDGQTVIRLTDSDTNPIALGDKLARQAFEIGASTILRNDSN